MKMKIMLVMVTAALLSCGNKPPEQPPAPIEQEAPPVSAGEDWQFFFSEDEAMTGEFVGEMFYEDTHPARIIIPYAKEYLSLGQETRIMVYLENGDYGDELDFSFAAEPEKNSIEIEGIYNVAIIKAVREGEQYVEISHPKAQESRVIVYDVLPAAPPPPPEIDVSESPMIVAKDETKSLRLTLLNGTAADQGKFQFQVIENAYAIEVRQNGGTLSITGIAPGAGKIRITNPASLRDYDVMVIVD